MSVPNKCRCELCGSTDNRRTASSLNPYGQRLSDYPTRTRSRRQKALASRTRRARDRADLRLRFAEGI